MKPKDVALRNLQRERNERGEDFQAEMRRSWGRVSNLWRMRIKDGGGGTRPADEIVLLEEVNILAEHKRTQGHKFELSMLRPDQQRGLYDFDTCLARNFGIVCTSFYDPGKGLDEAYGFRLVTALRYMNRSGMRYIHLDAFRRKALPCAALPRIEAAELTYDVGGLVDFVTNQYKQQYSNPRL